MKDFLRFCLGLLLLLGLSGCLGPKIQPLVLDEDYTASHPRQLILLELSFLDPPLDSELQDKAREAIAVQVVRVLQSKGYSVVVQAAAPANVWSVKGRQVSDMQRLARKEPATTQGLLHVQVDHFLWAGISDRKSSDNLEIYATAGLYQTGSGKELWRSSGMGYSWETSHVLGLYGPDLQLPAETLAEDLFATLPPAR